MQYSEMSDESMLILACLMAEDKPKCEYRSPEFDGGTQQGRMIPCRSTAVMWTDRGLRCEEHRHD